MIQQSSRNHPYRKSIRLKEYDYSQAGSYFVTLCTKDRKILFGDVIESGVRLNALGLMVKHCWGDLSRHYSFMEIDASIVMPNHFHGIIMITENSNVGAGFKPAPTLKHHALSEIVRALKTFSSRQINEIRGTHGQPVWQRNYYEHVIRNEIELEEIREYVRNNPLKWLEDDNHPLNIRRS